MVEFKNPITKLRSNRKKRKLNKTLRGMDDFLEFYAKPKEEQEELWRIAKKREENRLTWLNVDASGKFSSILSIIAIAISVVSLVVSIFK